MKRLLSLLVTGSLLVTPALAAQTDVEASFPAVRESASFVDVANGSWYTNAAGLCYVTGLLNGTGNGNFSPSRSVTIGEAAALAARIHHILNGGDSTLPEAPETWGQVILTRADGTSAGFHQNSDTGFWLDEKNIQLCFHVDESWKAAEGQTVTLTLNGADYTGTLTERGDGSFAFQLSDATRDYENYTADLWDALWQPAPGDWSRNTAYYLETVLHTGPDQINGLVMMEAADGTYAVVDSTKDWAAVPFTPNWSCKLLGDGSFISQASNDADPILHDRTGASIATLTGGGHWDVLSDGLAPCLDESARLYGFVNTKGEWVIAPQYIEVKSFRDGYAIVKQEGGWGVIDTTGKQVIPCSQPWLEHRGGPYFYSDAGQWLTADGSAVPAAASSYNGQNITLTGDYFPCGTYYLDRNFQPVTPQIFDWTGPVDENGQAFVGLDGATYRITLK